MPATGTDRLMRVPMVARSSRGSNFCRRSWRHKTAAPGKKRASCMRAAASPSSFLVQKPVTHPVDCLDIARAGRVVLEFLAEVFDMGIDCVIITIKIVTEHDIH